MGKPVKLDELQRFLKEKLGRDVSLARFSHDRLGDGGR